MNDRSPVGGVVLTPLRNEYRLAREALAGAFKRSIGGAPAGSVPFHRSTLILHTGVGPESTRNALRSFLHRYRPERALITGFCAGTRRAVETGSLLLAREILPHPSVRPGIRAQQSVRASNLLVNACSEMDEFVTGSLMTVRDPVFRRKEKRSLGRKWGCDAIDTETAVAASCLQDSGIPFLAVRVVLDNIYDDLASLKGLIHDHEEPTAGQVFCYMLQHPETMAPLVNLSRNFFRAAARLKRFLRHWYLQQPVN